MKTIHILLLSLALLLVSFTGSAQIICATSQGVNRVYTQLDTAIAYADSGSILYLSGGTFGNNVLNLSLSKSLNFVGAGYWPDSTTATGKTILAYSTFFLTDGSTNSSFTGIDFSCSFETNNTTASLTNIIITRCIFSRQSASLHFGDAFVGNNFTLSECIFTTNPFGNYQNNSPGASAIFDECLFLAAPQGWQVSTSFKHCTFVLNNPTSTANGTGFYLQSCIFQNCAFVNCNLPAWTYNSGGNTFQNCITNDSVLPVGNVNDGANINVNTIFNVNSSNFLVNGTYPFSYDNDYHLLSTCPGHNYATDGTDCGIYGTTNPFKPGAVPYNPHFSLNNIAPATNSSGELNLNIIVGAQSR